MAPLVARFSLVAFTAERRPAQAARQPGETAGEVQGEPHEVCRHDEETPRRKGRCLCPSPRRANVQRRRANYLFLFLFFFNLIFLILYVDLINFLQYTQLCSYISRVAMPLCNATLHVPQWGLCVCSAAVYRVAARRKNHDIDSVEMYQGAVALTIGSVPRRTVFE